MESDALDYMIGKYVQIIDTYKIAYKKDEVLGRCGYVERISGNSIGVLVDGKRNRASEYGVYWFYIEDLKILEGEENKMTGFKRVAIVNLLEDCNKKDYGFALYDEEFDLFTREENQLVVVNVKTKDNPILGTVKEIVFAECYDKNVTAQVIGVVNMDGYIARVEEEKRIKELAKKKAAIERELEAEINKRKSVEYYEEMAKKYSDNIKLTELVIELKSLGV